MPVDPGHRDFPKTTSDYLNCPHCGCPNKVSDTICSYCDAPLASKAGMSVRFRRAFESLKWRYKLKSPRSSASAAVKKYSGNMFTLILGAALALLGGWFFLTAVSSSSFSEFIIGALFMLYGVYTIIHVLKPNIGR